MKSTEILAENVRYLKPKSFYSLQSEVHSVTECVVSSVQAGVHMMIGFMLRA